MKVGRHIWPSWVELVMASAHKQSSSASVLMAVSQRSLLSWNR